MRKYPIYVFLCPKCEQIGERQLSENIVCPHCGELIAILNFGLIKKYEEE